MTVIPARMQQFNDTTSGWAVNDRVLLAAEWGFEYATGGVIKAKIGDGSKKWSELAYFAPDSSGINAAVQAALDAKLPKAGGALTGPLTLAGDAATSMGAVTLQQLDSVYTFLTTSLTSKLDKAGGSLTGFLSLHADPTSPAHAATKSYVDAGIGTRLNKAGDTMGGPLELAADPVSDMQAATMRFVTSGSYLTTVGGSSTYAGKVVRLNASGQIDSSMLPPTGSYLGTIDLTASYALSGSFSGGSYYAVNTSGTINASWLSHLNGSPTVCGAGQFIFYNTTTSKWDLVGDTTSSSAITGKLDKSGGTMTGTLILAADPTSAMHAATKNYVDTKLAKAGGVLTGPLYLFDDPTDPEEAATKGYVDAVSALSLKFSHNLSDLDNKDTALSNLGGTTLGISLFKASSASVARGLLGASTVGGNLFVAADAAAGRSAIGAAASGANTDITALALANTGLKIYDADGTNTISIIPTSDLTANRTLSVATGNANRVVTILGDVTLSQDYSSTARPQFAGIREAVYTITDAVAFEINPVNGSKQIITLGANRKPKGTSFAAGDDVTLHINDGTGFTIDWTDTTFGATGIIWLNNTVPTLATSGYTVVELWKVGSQVYGAYAGTLA